MGATARQVATNLANAQPLPHFTPIITSTSSATVLEAEARQAVAMPANAHPPPAATPLPKALHDTTCTLQQGGGSLPRAARSGCATNCVPEVTQVLPASMETDSGSVDAAYDALQFIEQLFTDDQVAGLQQAVNALPCEKTLWLDIDATSNSVQFQGEREDLVRSLAPDGWVTGAAMSRYMQLMNDRSGSSPCIFLDTLAYAQLCERSTISCLERWNLSLTSASLIFLPINSNNGSHWTLAVADTATRVVRYYDSLFGNASECYPRNVSAWLDSALPGTPWRVSIISDSPLQADSSSCGAFVLLSTELLSRRLPLIFSQRHVQRLRCRLTMLLFSSANLQAGTISELEPEALFLFFDGGARGNPGPAGAGALLCRANGTVLWSGMKFLGTTTNNVAEYEGLIMGVQAAARFLALMPATTILHVRGDSSLVLNQVRGTFKVNRERLILRRERAVAALGLLKNRYILSHVLRKFNKGADALANAAMDTKASAFEDRPAMRVAPPEPFVDLPAPPRDTPSPRARPVPPSTKPHKSRAPATLAKPRRAQKRKTTPSTGTTTSIAVGTANLRSETHVEALMATVVRPRELDVVGLTEVKRWEGETIATEGYDYIPFHEPLLRDDDFTKSRRGGCGFLVNHSLRARTIVLQEHSTPNMGWIRIRSTNSSEGDRYYCVFYGVCSNRFPEKAPQLLDDLDAKVAFFTTRGEVVLLGDFNAHVGLVLGPNCLPYCDASGKRLMQIAADHDLMVLNVHDFCEGKITRMQGDQESVIDFILAPRTLVHSSGAPIPNCRVEETCFYGSDHRVVWSRLRDHSARSRPTKGKWLSWNFRSLGGDVDWNGAYASALREEMECWTEWMDALPQPAASAPVQERQVFVDAVANVFSKSVLLAAEIAFERREVSARAKPWWNREVAALFEVKSQAYHAYRLAKLDSAMAEQTAKASEALRAASRRFSHAASRARQSALDERLHAIEDLYTTEMEHAARPNHGLYYRKVKESMGRHSTLPATLLSAKGDVLTEQAAKSARWKEHFQEGAGDSPVEPANRAHVFEVEYAVTALAETQRFIYDLDKPFTCADVARAQRRSLRANKAGGLDSILPELLQRHGPEPKEDSGKVHPFEFLTTALHSLFDTVWRLEVVPMGWKQAAIFPIYKKGSREDCSNYRPIALLSVLGKLMDAMVTARLDDWLETNDKLSDLQWAFRRDRGPTDLVWLVSEVCERRREEGLQTFLCAIDVTKAYDTVWHDGLFKKLADMGVEGKMWRVLRQWYKDNSSCVLVDGDRTDMFPGYRGVRQGAPSSPTLYSVFINDVCAAIQQSGYGVTIAGIWVGVVLFADDMLLMAQDEAELHAMMRIIEQCARKWRYSISDKKSSVMVASCSTRRFVPCDPFTFNDKEVLVEWFIKYLGVELATTGSWRQVADRLAQSTKSRFGMMAAAGVHRFGYSPKTSSRLFCAMARPISEYGTDVWEPATNMALHLQRVHNWAARTIEGQPRHTAEPALLGDLGWYPASSRRDELKLRRFYRLHKMKDTVVKRVYLTRRQDFFDGRRRNAGKPWCYQIDAITKRVGLRDYWLHPDVRFEEVDRSDWNEIVHKAVCADADNQWREQMATMPSLRLYRRVMEERVLQSFLGVGTRQQQATMRRLRAGVLNLPAIEARMRPCSTPSAEHDASPRPCLLCGGCGPVDEEHLLVGCAALDQPREAMWRSIAEAAKCTENVDWSFLVTGSLDERVDLLLLKGPLEGLNGQSVAMEKAPRVVAAILCGVDELWQAYQDGLRGEPRNVIDDPDSDIEGSPEPLL